MGNYLVISVYIVLYLCFFPLSVRLSAQNSFALPPKEPSVYAKKTDILTEKEVESYAGKIFPLPSAYVWKTEYRIESPGGIHFTLFPHTSGLILTGEMIKINLNKKGKVVSVLGKPNLKNLNPVSSDSFPINENRAEEIALNRIKGKSFSVKRIAYRNENRIIGAYEVFLTGCGDDPGPVQRMIIDGASGEILFIEPAYTHVKSETEGKGTVFNPDPMTSAQVFYQKMTPYADNDDRNAPFFDEQYRQVELKDLTFRNGKYFLEGPYVRLRDEESPGYQPVSEPEPVFHYDRSFHGFEETNCYYHIDTWQRYIQSLGFTNLYNRPVPVDAHGTVRDNSYFSSPEKSLFFGTGGVDDAEDADVIIHEYNHAISAEGSPSSNFGRERRALDEGICDYFAASYSRVLNPFRWADLYTWDGHNEFWDGRTAQDARGYLEVLKTDPTIHILGQTWASAMMEAFETVGKEVSDKISLQQLYMNATNMTFPDAARTVLDADTLLFEGLYTEVYKKVFCKYGLFSPEFCTVSAEELQFNSLIKVFPNPATDKITLTDLPEGTYRLTLSNLLGQTLQSQTLNINQSVDWPLQVSGGIFILEIFSDERPVYRQKLVVSR